MITVSHRPALLKYHDYLLNLSGKPESWHFSSIGSSEIVEKTLIDEIKDLKAKIADEDQLVAKLQKINAELGVKTNAIKK